MAKLIYTADARLTLINLIPSASSISDETYLKNALHFRIFYYTSLLGFWIFDHIATFQVSSSHMHGLTRVPLGSIDFFFVYFWPHRTMAQFQLN